MTTKSLPIKQITEDAMDEEEEAMLLVEMGYSCEVRKDLPMPPLSRIAPGFIPLSYFMMHDYI